MTALAYSDWIGRTETQTGVLTQGAAAMLQATVQMEATAPLQTGDVMPQLWHWAAFNETVPMAQLAQDGHPKRGGFLPPVPLERRMWAAGDLTFVKPLRVGEALSRVSTIAAVTEKDGGTGPMVFVTVKHEVSGTEGVAIRETQDIVYLRIPDRFTPPKAVPVPETPAFDQAFPVTPALLFRYSALTFNAHRIHYDLEYSKEVEKYPGLIVHGPLQATLLMDRATAYAEGRAPTGFKFRGIHPMFHFEDLRLLGVATEDGTLSLCTGSPRGHQGLKATAVWEDAS